MKTKRHSILVVDDAPENITVLNGLLRDDYTIHIAKNGEKALELAERKIPDLILLDIVMPRMDGYEVCRQLKENLVTKEIPVIFITSMSEESDETKGFELGAVDYIVKPFRPAIVKARVRTHILLEQALKELRQLYSMALDANPVTGLPGNNTIRATIENAINAGVSAAVVYIDLDNFKAFNDKYGFACGDDVILFTRDILQEAVKGAKCDDVFLGHIGGDDFMLVAPSESVEEITSRIIDSFDKGILEHYRSSDVLAGKFISVDRQGRQREFPLMSISMAAINLDNKAYSQYIEVNDACAELKKEAKKLNGSNVLFDRRKAHSNN